MTGRRPIPSQLAPRRVVSGSALALLAMFTVVASVLSWLAVRRHNAFWTARFDVGNMWQAIWNTAHGDILLATDPDGNQTSRLAGHVDPLLVLFAPLAWFTDSPTPILVLQVVGVCLGAIPMYLLAHKWHGEGAWPLAAAAAYLLSLPLSWTVLDEFHPIAFAAPLLVAVIWAIEEHRNGFLVLFAGLALASKEEVGLALVGLGVWMALRHGRRLAGTILSAVSVVWVALCFLVIIPHFNSGQGSVFVARYGEFGATAGAVVTHVLTHPWEVVTVGLQPDRLAYLAWLLLPLLLLPFGAPTLASAALPEIFLNGLAAWSPQHSIEFHYVSVPAGILLPAAILGAANVRDRWTPGRPFFRRFSTMGGSLPFVLVAAAAAAMVVRGPLPWFGAVSKANEGRLRQYEPLSNVGALRRAVKLIPPNAVVSSTNNLGGHLSGRRRVLSFPATDGAQYIAVDLRIPTIGFRPDGARFTSELLRLRAEPGVRLISDDSGVQVYERRATP